jgi:hypothetical protein
MRHEKNAVIDFRRNMLDLAGRKTNLPAHDGLDATIESLGPPKFSRQAFWSRISGWQGLYCIERRLSYTPFRQTA